MIIQRGSRRVWIPSIFIRWIDKFEGIYFEFEKYYHRALEEDGSRWT